jgi:hypothetical protein
MWFWVVIGLRDSLASSSLDSLVRWRLGCREGVRDVAVVPVMLIGWSGGIVLEKLVGEGVVIL